MKSDRPDAALTLYQLHSRYVILAGLKMEDAAKIWNEMKGRYASPEDHMNALLATLPHPGSIDDTASLDDWSVRAAVEGDEAALEVKRRIRESMITRCRLEFDHFECQACGFSAPKIVEESGDIVDLDATVLEVHHVDPLADGKRTTLMQDLVTLCPTCHRTLHGVAKTLGHRQVTLDLLDRCTKWPPTPDTQHETDPQR